jgi:gluconokinase
LIRSELGDRFHQTTGCRFHPMFPVFKLASMRLEKAPALQAAKRIVSIKALLMHKLTGVWLEDHGIASASGLFNILKRRWSEEILDLLGLNAGYLPEVASRNQIAGGITGSAAAEFGLPPETPVVNGTGDGFAANVGSACESLDKLSVTLGTSAVVRQTLAQPALVAGAGTFCYMADENAYLLGCAGSNGGNVLDWGRNILGATDQRVGTDLPIFIPLLHGERSPEWDPDLTGSWHGLKASHTAADLSRSILEGVIFNLAHFLEIVQTASATRAADLVLSGNGFLDPLAAPLLAAIPGTPVWMPEQPGFLTIRGAAICALRALGEPVPELRLRRIPPLDDAKILQRYAEYRRFRGTLPREK